MGQCTYCSGTGKMKDAKCAGTGKIQCRECHGQGTGCPLCVDRKWNGCDECGGSGSSVGTGKMECRGCGGTGKV